MHKIFIQILYLQDKKLLETLFQDAGKGTITGGEYGGEEKTG